MVSVWPVLLTLLGMASSVSVDVILLLGAWVSLSVSGITIRRSVGARPGTQGSMEFVRLDFMIDDYFLYFFIPYIMTIDSSLSEYTIAQNGCFDI